MGAGGRTGWSARGAGRAACCGVPAARGGCSCSYISAAPACHVPHTCAIYAHHAAGDASRSPQAPQAPPHPAPGLTCRSNRPNSELRARDAGYPGSQTIQTIHERPRRPNHLGSTGPRRRMSSIHMTNPGAWQVERRARARSFPERQRHVARMGISCRCVQVGFASRQYKSALAMTFKARPEHARAARVAPST